MPGFVAYYRVSTDRQGESGLGLDAQRAAVSAYLVGHPGTVAEFTEIESGRKNNRPQLTAALAACRQNQATLLIASLDRLGRNLHFISGLMETGVEFVAADMPQANRFMIHVRAAYAEEERSLISKRTKDALHQVKADLAIKGTRVSRSGRVFSKLGNPRAREALALARAARHSKPQELAPEVLALLITWRDQGKGLREIAREFNSRNIRTPNGCQWFAQTVKDRLDKACPSSRISV